MCNTLEMGVNVHMCLVGSFPLSWNIYLKSEVCFSWSILELKQKFSKLADINQNYEEFKIKILTQL